METLRIFLFGQVRLFRGEAPLAKFPTTKSEELFTYLVLQRQRTHSRDAVAGVFWGDSPDELARKSLRTALWRLRGLIEPDGCEPGTYLVVDHDQVGFNTQSDYWLDVEEFESRLTMVPVVHFSSVSLEGPFQPKLLDELRTTIDLYQGDLLQDFYEDWCLYDRQRLQDMFLNALATSMACYRSQGAYEEALRCGRRILSYDPLLEEVHRELMRLHCLMGNRAAALRQYQVCRATLAKELSVEPMDETSALYAQIAQQPEPANEGVAPSAGSRGGPSPLTPADKADPPLASRVDDVLQDLRLAEENAERASANVRRGIARLNAVRRELGQPGESIAPGRRRR